MGKGRVLLFTAALATATLFYGNHRFHASRYKPQCDTLPGICVYSGGEPARATFPLEGMAEYATRRAELKFENKKLVVEGGYPSYNGIPEKITITQTSEGKEGESRLEWETKGSAQLVLGPRGSILLKGGKEESFAVSAYLGLAEMLGEPAPLRIECGGEVETPEICKTYFLREKQAETEKGSGKRTGADESLRIIFGLLDVQVKGCETERALAAASAGKTGIEKCRLRDARAALGGEIEPPTSYLEPFTQNANMVLEDIEASGPGALEENGVPWKKLDWLFGIGMVLAIPVIEVSIALRKKIRRMRKMEMDEKRKKLFEEYRSRRKELIEKLDKCEDLTECENIMGEFRELDRKIEREDKELHRSLLKDMRKFEDFWMGRRGGLGGPKRIFRSYHE